MTGFVDVDALVMDVLRAALVDPVTVVEELPRDWAARYPVVVGYRLPGGGAVDAEFGFDRALVQVDVYHGDRGAALQLAADCRAALLAAWLSQRQYPHGSITAYSETAAPAVVPLPGQPAGERFVPATYELHVCP